MPGGRRVLAWAGSAYLNKLHPLLAIPFREALPSFYVALATVAFGQATKVTVSKVNRGLP